MGDIEVSNILIVESENDKFFIEAIVASMNLPFEIEKPICQIDEYECMGGIGKLKNKLKELNSRILKGDEIYQVGIIVDADNIGISKRKQDIETLILEIFPNNTLKFEIFIMNIDGKGELETVLRKIKSNPSPIADCLEEWQKCLVQKKLSQKDFDKLWIQIYQRYDCCSSKEKKQANRKCNNEVSLKEKQIYNFNATIPELDRLKSFLKKFKFQGE